MHNPTNNNHPVTVGAVVAAFLEQCGVKAAFGVISIHNMPILDAFAQRGAVRFVPARGEAGAGNMADAYARSTASLGVCLTSTGPAAGNIAGSMVEALTAGAPLLHITGQIETPYLDKGMSYIHEAPDQLTMLKAVSKAALRVRSVETVLGTLKRAVQLAMTAPTGPVSVEIPIDIQSALTTMPADLSPLPIELPVPSKAALDALAARLAAARRPMLWVGGGARHAGAAIRRLQKLGFGVVTTTQGRGTVPEDDAGSLGSYNIHKPVEALYQRCDAMLVVGSRLRGNETLKYELKLPRPLLRIDADAAAEGRGYATEQFVCGDSALALEGLADRLEAAKLQGRPRAAHRAARRARAGRGLAHDGLGPYADLVKALQSAAGRNFNWVRDVTVSNSTWGNRELRIFEPSAGVHATGGGIGQGMPMAIGAACRRGRNGVGPQDLLPGRRRRLHPEPGRARHGRAGKGRHGHRAHERQGLRRHQEHPGRAVRRPPLLRRPAHARLRAAVQVAALPHTRVQHMDDLKAKLGEALAQKGPFLLEIDMLSIGDFKSAFAGPPTNTITQIPALGKAAASVE
jgi:acetolactate synthase-1/2/3 large subunit